MRTKMSGKNSGDDWEFLKSVHSLLEAGNVLNTTGDKPIVSFKFPEELKVRFLYYMLQDWTGLEYK